jgi:hypothetical protein
VSNTSASVPRCAAAGTIWPTVGEPAHAEIVGTMQDARMAMRFMNGKIEGEMFGMLMPENLRS